MSRYVKANDARGRWDVYEELDGGDCWLAEFESESDAYEFAAAPELLGSLMDLFEQCVMMHKYGGEICNQREADAAVARAKAAIKKAEERS